MNDERGTCVPPAGDASRLPLIEVVMRGDIDAETMPRVRGLLDDAVALRPARLVVDLTTCDYLDAAGIGLLVDAHRQVWLDGGRLTLRGLSPRVRHLLALARVDRVLRSAPPARGRDPRPGGLPVPT